MARYSDRDPNLYRPDGEPWSLGPGRVVTPGPNPKRRIWPWLVGLSVLLVIGICTTGALLSGPSDDRKNNPPVTPTTIDPPAVMGGPQAKQTATPTKKVAVKPTPKPKPSLDEGLYHIGEDAPAGTYRLRDRIAKDDMCYWMKSSDAEGSNIIENSLGEAGRLQVTLKKGQWFTSSRCGVWVRK